MNQLLLGTGSSLACAYTCAVLIPGGPQRGLSEEAELCFCFRRDPYGTLNIATPLLAANRAPK